MSLLRHPTKTLFSVPLARGSKLAILGIPFDSNTSCMQGSRLAPSYIRLASEYLEEYSILYRADIRDLDISDWGDVDVSFGDFSETLRRTAQAIGTIGAEKYVFIGGDHTVSIMTVMALRRHIEKFVQLDAHADFYEEYKGNKYSHACTLRRIVEILGPERVIIAGIRSASKDCIEGLEEFGVEYYTSFELMEDEDLLARLISKADYLAIDMDVLDPAYVPRVSCPEPLGISPQHLICSLRRLRARFLDITELTPESPFDRSAIVAATIIRESSILMSSWAKRKHSDDLIEEL